MQPGDVMGLLIMVGGIASVVILRGPLGRAIADRISGRAAPPPDPRHAQLTDHALAELDDLKHRVSELEERQDFTERVLSQQTDRPRLGGGT